MTYADDYDLRDKDLAKINDIADAIDGLLIDFDSVIVTSGTSTTSTTYVGISGAELSVTVASGQMVLLMATLITGSTVADAGGFFKIQNVTDSTEIGRFVSYVYRFSAASPTHVPFTLIGVDATPQTGSNTYQVQYKSGSSPSTTIMADDIRLSALVFRNGAA